MLPVPTVLHSGCEQTNRTQVRTNKHYLFPFLIYNFSKSLSLYDYSMYILLQVYTFSIYFERGLASHLGNKGTCILGCTSLPKRR